MGFGVASRSAWKILSNVKLVTRIEGMLSRCPRRHGRDTASERIAVMLCSFRKVDSEASAMEESNSRRERSEASPSS